MTVPIGDGRRRCAWAGTDPVMAAYHDDEWGAVVHDDAVHFEFLILEGAQAGLSWSTILNKRDGYRRAFAGFDPVKVARFTPAKVEKLLADPSIVRNRLKVEASVNNGRCFLQVRKECGSFDAYLWGFVDGEPVTNRWRSMSQIPAETDLSRAVSKDLKRRGFKFVGPTIMYAHLQAVGVINDHVRTCFRWPEV